MRIRKILIAVTIFLLFLPTLVLAQESNYRLGFSQSRIELATNDQYKVQVFAFNATDQNAAELRLKATGGVEILGIQGNNDTLSLGAENDSQSASIDVATTEDFKAEQGLATVIITLNNTEGGTLILTEESSVGGIAAELEVLTVEYSSSASNNSLDSVVDPGVDPVILALIAVAALALLGLVVMVITRDRDKN